MEQESVCLFSGTQEERGVSFQQQPSAQSWVALPPASPAQPPGLPAWGRLERAPEPWRRAPLAAAARSAALPALPGRHQQPFPRMLDPSCPALDKSKNPSFCRRDLALRLRRPPSPMNWPSPHLCLLPPTPERSLGIVYWTVTDPFPVRRRLGCCATGEELWTTWIQHPALPNRPLPALPGTHPFAIRSSAADRAGRLFAAWIPFL